MIRMKIDLDQDDICAILARHFHVDPEKVLLYYMETNVQDDIRAHIEFAVDDNLKDWQKAHIMEEILEEVRL